jgi:hypothetical protein
MSSSSSSSSRFIHPHRRTSVPTRPSWQPDASAVSCPICTSTFTFFNRRHHCRRCGRVVCAACSPHRITIPRAFIVRPPKVEVIDLTGDSPPPSYRQARDDADDEGSEGEVRICEECLGTTPRAPAISDISRPVEVPRRMENRRRRQSVRSLFSRGEDEADSERGRHKAVAHFLPLRPIATSSTTTSNHHSWTKMITAPYVIVHCHICPILAKQAGRRTLPLVFQPPHRRRRHHLRQTPVWEAGGLGAIPTVAGWWCGTPERKIQRIQLLANW